MSLAQHAPTRADTMRRPDPHREMMLDELVSDIERALKLHKRSIFVRELRPRTIEFVIIPCDQEVKRVFEKCSAEISALEIGPNDRLSRQSMSRLCAEAAKRHNKHSPRKVHFGEPRSREVKVKGKTRRYFAVSLFLPGD